MERAIWKCVDTFPYGSFCVALDGTLGTNYEISFRYCVGVTPLCFLKNVKK